jgi:uncharacterized UBP type Zn finger protein
LVLNIKRTRKHVQVCIVILRIALESCEYEAHEVLQREEPPQKITKLAIAAETEEDRYDTTTKVICYECQVEDVDKTSGKLPQVVDGVLQAMTFARQEEVKAWEQEYTPCEHTLCLEQQKSRKIESQGTYLRLGRDP